ncbi:Fic family protein [Ketobacter alkanivorans]|uniref:Cell filamentation protein Fic n=1 Tax=Ketobacter alkanivorans TaxID=1917421 RepID=A0A2K9LPG9_9GAMM|nr:Fic family protein [Ketobacter alkanivorans]AUM14147.1 cell filamentation protein Fic [Ketobacter alkanivorans]
MASPSEKLAHSLSVLKEIQDRGQIAIRAGDMTRTHRERLLKNGFIREVMKGWYIPARADEAPGESTAWYASFWGFARDYLNSRFDEDWCLSPEQSLALHSGNWTVPRQLLVRTPKGGNKPTGLLHDTSIFDLRLELPDKDDIVLLDGLRTMSLPAALIACPPNYYTAKPLEMRSALSMINEPSDVLRRLLEGNHSTVAGRLAGAFRNIGRTKIADTILDTMRSAGHTVNETDPFAEQSTVLFGNREVSPYVNRLRMMWAAFREPILEHFPPATNIPKDIKAYLTQIDDIYASDAYHSLSIEGYKVSAELIERVREGNWNPASIKADPQSQRDRDQQNTLAARGYWQAFQAVKKTIKDVLEGKDAGEAAEDDYSAWYRELFGPSVVAGIIGAADLAGYRNRAVYIRQSMHTPPSPEAVRDLIPAFFELLREEQSPEVRVVLGHFIFVYIHPFMDGNGRTGRFLMNVMLAAGGYPWLVIPVERRSDYMSALEAASVDQNIEPFTMFLSDLLKDQT